MSTSDLSQQLHQYSRLEKQINSLTELLILSFESKLTEEQQEELQALPRLRGKLRQMKRQLQFALLAPEPCLISDTTAHQIAHKLKKEVTEEQIDEGWEGDWLPNILGQCFPEEYAARFASIKPMVLLYEPGPHLRFLVNEAVRAYCLELPTATVAVARSLVEAAVVDIAVKIGRVKDEATIAEMRMCERISSLIDRSVSKSSPLRQSINAFMASASDIVHGDVAAEIAEARRLLEDAFALVGRLYIEYRTQYTRVSA